MSLTEARMEEILDAAFAAAYAPVPSLPSRRDVRRERINLAVSCAKSNMTKSETADQLGMNNPSFAQFCRLHIPDIKFRDGRRKIAP